MKNLSFALENGLTKKEYDVLAKSIKRVLKKAIKAGGTSISDFKNLDGGVGYFRLLYTSPSPRDRTRSRMPSSA